MEGYLALGFLVGMGHALEADHLTALATLKRDRGWRIILRGAAWGAGHTLTLFAICSIVILFSLALSPQVSAALEAAVGLMLVLLGADVLRRMRRKSVHFHVHEHSGGSRHLHAHTHSQSQIPHQHDEHDHEHSSGFPFRALLLGLVHGAAGSAGLLALIVAATREPIMALAYIMLFGFGSIFGMMALSVIVFWPVALIEQQAKGLYKSVQYSVAALAMGLGVSVIWNTFPAIIST